MLYKKLKNNSRIPFHMPGHKRNTELLGDILPYSIDITEIADFDNLHNPSGVIKEIENKIKSLYDSKQSFLLVNGSTCGILAAIHTVVKDGDTVLMARNCHKSVYNAVKLVRAKTVYLQPEYDNYGILGKITPEQVEKAIALNNIKLLVIITPTYEGVISDIDAICDIAHSNNIPVLVDSAHGAHFIKKTKADIVIMSLHKTLPALTQCAIANINGCLVNPEEFRINLSIFETSSPSYILMTSIENCVDFLNNNKYIFQNHYNLLNNFYNNLAILKHLKVLHYDDYGKIIIFTGNSSITAKNLSIILREKYNIEIEMTSKDYIIAISTICDSAENLDALANALIEIDNNLEHSDFSFKSYLKIPQKHCEAYEIQEQCLVEFKKIENKISCEYVWAYPPGIPLIVPGEIISKEFINYINEFKNKGIEFYSTYGKFPKELYCQNIE